MDLTGLLQCDELFVHVSRRRWFGPRRLAVQGRAGIAVVRDGIPRLQRIISRICVGWQGLEPAELYIVPQGGGAALVVRRRMFPLRPRAIELTDAAGTVIASVRGSRLFGLDLRDRGGRRAGRIRCSWFSAHCDILTEDGREIGQLAGQGLGWRRDDQPGWRITRGRDASAGDMLLLLAAAFAVHLRWYDR
jgi:hypothetical protein